MAHGAIHHANDQARGQVVVGLVAVVAEDDEVYATTPGAEFGGGRVLNAFETDGWLVPAEALAFLSGRLRRAPRRCRQTRRSRRWPITRRRGGRRCRRWPLRRWFFELASQRGDLPERLLELVLHPIQLEALTLQHTRQRGVAIIRLGEESFGRAHTCS